MKRSADAYLLKDKIYIAIRKKTTMGLEIFAGTVKTLNHSDDSQVIGVNVRKALDQFTFNQRHPSRDEMKVRLQPLLEAAGVKTSNAFSQR